MGRGKQAQRRAEKNRRRQARKSASTSAGTSRPTLPLHESTTAPLQRTGDERDELPGCTGSVVEHMDGAGGDCSQGDQCTGGWHTAAEECLSDPEGCDYCRTLICRAKTVIEHADGTIECEKANGVCIAPEHEEIGRDCTNAELHALAHTCGACRSSA